MRLRSDPRTFLSKERLICFEGRAYVFEGLSEAETGELYGLQLIEMRPSE